MRPVAKAGTRVDGDFIPTHFTSSRDNNDDVA